MSQIQRGSQDHQGGLRMFEGDLVAEAGNDVGEWLHTQRLSGLQAVGL